MDILRGDKLEWIQTVFLKLKGIHCCLVSKIIYRTLLTNNHMQGEAVHCSLNEKVLKE